MKDHPLPTGTPEKDIRRVKRLMIYLTSTGGHPLESLRFHIMGYTPEDRDESGGTAINDPSEADALIEDFMNDTSFPSPLLETPLDFPIQEKCFIALKLIGDFWEFSGHHGPVTTKTAHSGKRYYNLKRHAVAEKNRGVSFCAREPLKMPTSGKPVGHGINLYVDFLQDPNLRLPVTIDPDIENKGKTTPTPPPSPAPWDGEAR